MQKYLPVRMQNELHGREPVLRTRYERRENREKVIPIGINAQGAASNRCSFVQLSESVNTSEINRSERGGTAGRIRTLNEKSNARSQRR